MLSQHVTFTGGLHDGLELDVSARKPIIEMCMRNPADPDGPKWHYIGPANSLHYQGPCNERCPGGNPLIPLKPWDAA